MPIPEKSNVIPISIKIHIRALGFGQFGCLGFEEGVLIAQIISLTVSLTTLPQSVFFDNYFNSRNLYYYNICIFIVTITKIFVNTLLR